MKYTATRDCTVQVNASQAILTGIAPGGGLFIPQQFPHLDYHACAGRSYAQTAQKVLELYLTDYDTGFLKEATESVYGVNFSGKAGYVHKISKQDGYALELWHGPTCAFKDYALQLMPKLLVEAKRNLNATETTKILVATSGDTGKAALAGYAGLSGIKIAVFYPNDGTSEIQRLQMATQEGDNVAVYAVNGNFDDAQTGVKHVFGDAEIAKKLCDKNEMLSSANSINWGRLVPQIVYYFYAYVQLVANGEIAAGEKVNFCVPTGNFGDILAGYYAKQMGLPIDKLICASNQNNVLTDFLQTGVYNANRSFCKTTSPSMDILVSSNLERLLYHITEDAAQVKDWMTQLNENGTYTVPQNVLAQIQQTFLCGCADDEQAAESIHNCYIQNGYLMDPHTAVAYHVAKQVHKDTKAIILSTASPYKFAGSVLSALKEKPSQNEFETMTLLQQKTGLPIPESLAALREKQVRFNQIVDKQDIPQIALTL